MHCHIYSCKRLFMAFFLNKTGCPTDITQKKLCKEIGVGENDWIYEEGEEKKVELFLKWKIQLMSCWSKREHLTQSD